MNEPPLRSDTDGRSDSESTISLHSIAAPGRALGPYVLRELVGSGGMGEVWKAEQSSPVRRTVAVKLVKAGLDSAQVMARFEREKQALALMDHPHIAKVFDAGTTDQGRPYFVMEFVAGIPITDYCDRRKLDTRQRLGLFEKVCDAIQHAHRKAVIHRDLKPSNILVSDVEGTPLPKIIDFGVAKATTRGLTEQTMQTAIGQIIGTLEYMSPEQADLTNEDVDTRTDVYSLGAVLYELLTGALPFGRKELRQAGLDGMLRLLRESDPPRPSTRLSTLGAKQQEIARLRGTEPRHLVGLLKGGLDWIVMRALEKDRNRRYGSPQEIAQEIRRYLRDEPVLAGPPGPGYRIRKFGKRHRVGVAFAATGAVGVVVAFVLITVQNARITTARDQALLVMSTLQEMLSLVDPSRHGPDVTVRELLDETARTLEEKFANQPLVEAELRDTIGKTYNSLGDYDAAERHLAISVEKWRTKLGLENPRTIEAMTALAGTYLAQNRVADGDALAQEAWGAARRALGDAHQATLASQRMVAMAYVYQHRYEEAESLILRTLDIARRTLGSEDPLTIQIMSSLAPTYDGLGRYEDRLAITEKILAIYRRTLGEEHPKTLACKSSLAGSYGRMGRSKEARALYEECLAVGRRVFGAEHPTTLRAQKGIAETYYSEGRYDEALGTLQENLATARKALGPTHGATLASSYALERTYERLGRYEDAEALLHETLGSARMVLGNDNEETQQLAFTLGGLYLEQGRFVDADATYRESLAVNRRRFGEGHWRTNRVRYDLACSLALQGRRREAIAVLSEILEHGPSYFDRVQVGEDPDLKSLHGDPEFERIVEQGRAHTGTDTGTGGGS